MAQMTITRVLAEIDVLNKRIEKETRNARFIACVKNTATKVDGVQTKAEFSSSAQSSYDSIIDMIEKRKKLKAKLVMSNATTIVNICNKDYFVAEAIERKNMIHLEQALIAEMVSQYNKMVANYNRKAEELDGRYDEFLRTLGVKDSKNISETMLEAGKNFLAENGWSILDPIKLKEKIDALTDEVENFMKEVDFTLSECNSLTKIEIEE